MSEAAIYLAFFGFALSVFPIHIINYVYVNTGKKYASVNVGVYGINFFNINTVQDKPNHIQINGKDKKMNMSKFKLSFYKIFNMLCIFKIVQLGDYGIQGGAVPYVVLAQNCLTTAIYKFIQINGNFCKLRNYTILNQEHSEIHYYAKVVTILNLTVVAKILFLILTETLYAHKNKKKQRQGV